MNCRVIGARRSSLLDYWANSEPSKSHEGGAVPARPSDQHIWFLVTRSARPLLSLF